MERVEVKLRCFKFAAEIAGIYLTPPQIATTEDVLKEAEKIYSWIKSSRPSE